MNCRSYWVRFHCVLNFLSCRLVVWTIMKINQSIRRRIVVVCNLSRRKAKYPPQNRRQKQHLFLPKKRHDISPQNPPQKPHQKLTPNSTGNRWVFTTNSTLIFTSNSPLNLHQKLMPFWGRFFGGFFGRRNGGIFGADLGAAKRGIAYNTGGAK